MAYVVDLKKYQYTGPLDLLLDLIHEAKIDIKNIGACFELNNVNFR